MSTVSANATALPAFHPAVGHPMPRRGFLARLAALPLVGGSVALIGQPSSVAGQATPEMIEAYKTWLALELRFLTWRMAEDPYFLRSYRLDARADRKERSDTILGYEWYVGDSGKAHDDPYQHAALVMSAVGCDWRDHEGVFNFHPKRA